MKSRSLPEVTSMSVVRNSDAVSNHQTITLVDQLTIELTESARTHGLQAAAGLFSWARAANALRRGDWIEADADAQRWLEGFADLESLSVTRVFSQAMAAYTASAVGDAQRATALAEATLDMQAAKQFPEISAWCWATLGSLAYTEGDVSGTLHYLAHVSQEADSVTEHGCLTEPTRLFWEGDWIDALLDAERTEEALAAMGKLSTYGQRTGDLWSNGIVARCEGRMMQSPIEAEGLFHEAMTIFEKGKLEFEIARTFCTRGAHFRGQKASASFDIAEGFRRLQRMGAVRWANWSAQLLRPDAQSPSVDPDSPLNVLENGSTLPGPSAATDLYVATITALTSKTSITSTSAISAACDLPNRTDLSSRTDLPNCSELPSVLNRSSEVPLQLTPSELRVASLITTGSTYKEIAGALFISTKTVDFHLQAMYRKAKVNNRVEFVSSFLRMAHA
jgi:DNA-binding CsgD family transcriptional regulator